MAFAQVTGKVIFPKRNQSYHLRKKLLQIFPTAFSMQ
jgi:hypothetical protein